MPWLLVLAFACVPISAFAVDTDGDSIDDAIDIDDDNDGILDTYEGYSAATGGSADITGNGFDQSAIQAGFHGALYKLSNGNYAVTGYLANPDSTDALTLTELTPANGYTRSDEIVIGAYGGWQGGGIFVLQNGDFASVGKGDSIVASGASGTGWRVYDNSGAGYMNPGLPAGVTVNDIAAFRGTGGFRMLNNGGNMLTLLDTSGNLYYNGFGQTHFGLTDGDLAFSDGWGAFPALPGGAKIVWYEATLASADSTVVFVYADDGNYYTLGKSIHIGDGTASTDSSTWLQMTAPPIFGRPAQIATNGVTYYVLGTNGTLFSMGRNGEPTFTNGPGLLGTGVSSYTHTEPSWIVTGTGTSEGPMTNVTYISVTSNDNIWQNVSVILDDGTLRSWGSNNNNMIGTYGSLEPIAPAVVAGDALDNVTFVEVGGHITPIIQDDKVYNVGHNADGGFGDGTTTSRSVYEGYPVPGGLGIAAAEHLFVATTRDTDGDGIADHLDLDSDNDGISDLYESGVAAAIAAVDINNDGVRDDMATPALQASNDLDNDGLADVVDNGNDVFPRQTDSDGNPDFIDLDSDADGIADAIEARLTSVSSVIIATNDTDTDGVLDYFDTMAGHGGNFDVVNDDDSDGTPDYISTDSDGDQLSDAVESGLNGVLPVDVTFADADGTLDPSTLPDIDADSTDVDFRSFDDHDGDGIPDSADLDDDNDGILDTEEGLVSSSGVNPDMTANGYDENAIQAGFHGALYKLSGGGYAVTGFGGLAGGGNAFTLTEISPANGYVRGDEAAFAAYGGHQGGGVFILDNGDYASVGNGDSIGSTGLMSSGWHIYDNSGPGAMNPGLPAGVTVGDIAALRGTGGFNSNEVGYQSGVVGGGLLTMMDTSGNLYYNGRGNWHFGLAGGDTTFDSGGWVQYPSLPGGASVVRFDVSIGNASLSTGATSMSAAIIYADDGNFYTLGKTINEANGTGTISSGTWVQMTAPPLSGPPAQIATNGATYFVLDPDGSLYTVGRNSANPGSPGQLGLGESSGSFTQSTWIVVGTGTSHGPITNATFVSTAGNGTQHQSTSVILDDGTIRSWGSNNNDLIGAAGAFNAHEPIIPDVAVGHTLDNVTFVENGSHITPIIEDGQIFNVGHNASGGYGDGTYADRSEYEGVDIPNGLSFVAAEAPGFERDTDGDGLADHLDIDSDNDGISDLYESGDAASIALDANADGTLNLTEDVDSDLDGLMDVFEDGNLAADTGSVAVDTDTDGTQDYLDLDSDDDTIPDATEARATGSYVAYPATVDGSADSDNDGILDIYDTITAGFGFAPGELNNSFIAGANAANSDADDTADTIADYLDTDSDGDLIDDATEAGTIAVAPTYADPDGSVDDPTGLPELDDNVSDVDFRSPPNQPPAVTGVPATFATDEDITSIGDLSTGMLTGITDPEGDSIVIDSINGTPLTPGSAQSIPVNDGTVEVDASGVITFVPAANYNGPASFPYTVTDGNNSSAPITFNGIVNPINDPPIATVDGPIVVSEEVAGTVNVISDGTPDSDIDLLPSEILTVTVAMVDTNGDGTADPLPLGTPTPMTDATGSAIGTMQIDANGDLTFTPAPDYVGPVPVVAYTVSDPAGATASSTASFADVTNVNDPPLAINDGPITGVISGTTVNVDAVANDTDVDLVLGDILTITEIIDPAGPTVLAITPGVTVTLASGTQVTMLPDGTLDVTAAANSTAPESFDYTIVDTAGLTSQATVSLEFNQPPAVTGVPATFVTDEDITTIGDLSTGMLTGITDPEGDPIVIDSINGTPLTPGSAQSIPVTDGTVEVDASGVITFVPAANYNGPASFPYTVTDGNNSSAPITFNGTVNPINDPPMATADGPITVTEEMAGTVNVISDGTTGDSDPESDNLSVTAALVDTDGDGTADPLTLGSATAMTDAAGNAIGTMQVDANGDVTFTPAPDYVGPVPVVDYTISDPSGDTAMSTASFADVTNVNDPPLAINDGPITGVISGTTVNVDAVANDTDADLVLGDILTITEIIDPAGPTVLAITPGVTVTLASGTQVTMLPDGTLDVTAAANSTAPESFDYTIADTAGLTSQATVSLEFSQPPVVTADSATVASDVVAMIDLSDNTSDAENDVDISTIDLDPATPGIQNTLTTADGVWSVDPTGLVSFDPVPAFEGVASIPYTVEDDDGNVATPADVSVTVGGATPIATADTDSVPADTNAIINLADNVSDANNDLVLASIDLDPATAGIQNTLTTADGVWSIDPTGVVTFDPEPAFDGAAIISYTIEDDDGNVSNSADVTVTVAGAAPFADAETEMTPQDTDITIDVLNGDTDANGDLDPSTIDLDPSTPGIQTTYSIPGEGDYSVVGNQVLFDPLVTFTGNTSITYTVSDAAGNLSNVANLSIDVDILPDADGDGIPNISDLDDDNDGIPDLIEGTVDTDGDGIIDSLDLDSDNDGIPDVTEAGGSDTDGDGVIDGFTDTDLDGMDDATTATPLPVDDFDLDGLADYLDVDSDNDGLTDSLEAGGSDTDSDGIIDGFTDANGDGFDDATAAAALPIDDFDGDGNADYLDLDSDNDGITDTTEAGGIDADGDGVIDGFTDADADGLDDATATTPLATPDTDADGSPDHLDLDSDNDGLDDIYEAGGTDTDGDGMVDNFTDADGDGLDDAAMPPQGDFDGDGILDHEDLDSDNDGIPDAVEAANGPVDTDGDGQPDHLDLDSDNDGLPDVLEAGGADTDGDGVIDGFTDADNDGMDDATATTPLPAPDFDNDGIPDHLDVDSDNDGIPDAVEAANGVVDTDGDGQPDHLDLDSDNDGIPDSLEAPVSGLDSDGDGIDDIYDVDQTGGVDTDGDGVDDAISPQDTDADGVPDYLDLDSDNDGINDLTESGGNPTSEFNGDGVIDTPVDTDGDGLDDNSPATLGVDTDMDGTPDVLDLDSDGDGIPDAIEGNVDSDGDGIPDYQDLDSDNDGIPDVQEAPISGVDTDGDGIDDVYDVEQTGGTDANGDGVDDVIGAQDTDGDGSPDYLDIDSDNDGMPDVVEAGGIDSDGDGEVDGFSDANGDGIDDAIMATPLPINDTNGDGIPDYQELDSDSDGIPDAVEAGTSPNDPVDTDSDGTPDYQELDSDNDGIPDSVEAGSDATNPVDTDGDGTPDYLEQDSDNDGISDTDEAGSNPATPVDTDGDGIPDHLEEDSDNDGIPDYLEGTADTDGDGTPDYLDLDSDNDGIPDALEAGNDPGNPADTDGDGIRDFQELDSDNDGLPDSVEAGTDPANPVDTDGDGVMDFLEPDSDNDGIPDSVEAGSDPANPVDTSGDGIPDYLDLDSDNDGIPDMFEAGANPNQPVDTDGDNTPDFLEQDSDDDGIPDSVEAGDTPTAPVDTDGDGVPDFLELDSDNDGTPDSVEAGSDPANPVDTDGNGIPDYLEPSVIVDPTEGPLDSDGDGIPDSVEGLGDSDGDGVPDYLDIDADNDGLIDTYEAGANPTSPIDTDGDGLADYIDVDSDNDGLSDVLEAGGSDADGNGVVDGFNDLDGNGHDDAIALNPHPDPDFDGDGHVDHLDLDSDNDGLPDVWESVGVSADANGDGYLDDLTDVNGDGLADNYAANSLIDTDGDSATNHLDLDSDGDGAFDLNEAGGDDLNSDGLVDAWTDSDGDGVVDAVDVDITGGSDLDGDGIDDFADVDYILADDLDGDGIIDLFDGDVLGDGYLPFTVGGEPALPGDLPDVDGNGVADVLEPNLGAAQNIDIVRTGLSGSGCSVIPGSQRGSFDPMLLLLLVGSGCMFLGRRSRRSRISRGVQS